jgi:hypothetical protein
MAPGRARIAPLARIEREIQLRAHRNYAWDNESLSRN